jgi:hypothetical protein
MEVEVWVEGGAEAVEEGDGADPGVGSSAGAAAAQCGADGAEQDLEHGAGEGRVVMEEGTDPLGDGAARPPAPRLGRPDARQEEEGDERRGGRTSHGHEGFGRRSIRRCHDVGHPEDPDACSFSVAELSSIDARCAPAT